MTVATDAPGYAHTQKAPLGLILYGSVLLGCLIIPLMMPRFLAFPHIIIACAVGLLNILIASGFHHLTVSDKGDRLAIRFGPLPLFRRTVRYVDMEEVEPERTLFLHGLGIHYSIRDGWLWKLWGRDCVVIYFRNGKVLWLGTDDAANLTAFLQGKIAQSRE